MFLRRRLPRHFRRSIDLVGCPDSIPTGELGLQVYCDAMVTFSFLNPIDQPIGRRRLLGELKAGLTDPGFTSLRMIVAFAKSGPLLRMESLIAAERARGLRVCPATS